MINAVISVLDAPKEATAVSQVHSNEKSTATEVQAYAKISGKSWTYYVKDMFTSIGRNTSPQDQSVHIDLGPAKVVSRLHASISFNLNTGIWELRVLGRNGAKINFHRIPSGPNTKAVPLSSGTILDIGGTQMMFILPDQGPFIDPSALKYLNSKLVEAYAHTTKNPLLREFIKTDPQPVLGTKNANESETTTFKIYHNHFQHSTQQNNADQTEGYLAMYGTIIDPNFSRGKDNSTDLSRDENRNVKPPHSYATMITQAVLSSKEGELSLAGIYKYISENYAYYRYTNSGWQNSIRHNLSLNKAFEKVPRKPGEPGKGMKWRITEDYQREFLDKWHTGRISKVRRGSSVARQLQLHMTRYNHLPIQNEEFSNIKKNSDHLVHKASPSLVTYSNVRPPNTPSQKFLHSISQENQVTSQLSDQNPNVTNTLGDPQLAGKHQEVSKLEENSPQIQQQQKFLQQYQHVQSNQPTTSNSNISLPSLSGIRESSQSSISLGTLSTIAPQLSSVNDSLLHSPTKRFNVLAVEAYTPERGSHHISRSSPSSGNIASLNGQIHQHHSTSTLGQGQQLTQNGIPSANQSSSGVWNLLQFSSVNNTPTTIRNNSMAVISKHNTTKNLDLENSITEKDQTLSLVP